MDVLVPHRMWRKTIACFSFRSSSGRDKTSFHYKLHANRPCPFHPSLHLSPPFRPLSPLEQHLPAAPFSAPHHHHRHHHHHPPQPIINHSMTPAPTVATDTPLSGGPGSRYCSPSAVFACSLSKESRLGPPFLFYSSTLFFLEEGRNAEALTCFIATCSQSVSSPPYSLCLSYFLFRSLDPLAQHHSPISLFVCDAIRLLLLGDRSLR